MNEMIAKGLTIINQAEESLRQLLKTSIELARYEELAVLARWAEQLADIPNGRKEVSSTIGTVQSVGPSGKRRTNPPPTSVAGRKQGVGSKRKRKYPVFERAGENLVKIGWSKATKEEYQHRSPKNVAMALLEKMRRLSHELELLTMDEVLPIRLGDDDRDVPPYQSYLCLAWLRSIGAVKQHGRQGYSVVVKDDAATMMDSAWAALPLHHVRS
jgi:hypothetical protein